MSRSAMRWLLLLCSFWLLGPAAGWLAAGVRAPDGGPDASLLLSDGVIGSAVRLGGAMLLATAAGFAGGRLFGGRTGLFCAGLVMVWAAWALGTVDGVARSVHGTGVFRALALEGAIVGVVLAACAWVMVRGRARGMEDGSAAGAPASAVKRGRSAGPSLAALAVCIGAGGFAAWAMARSALPGQAIFAAAAAGIVGTMAGSLIDPRAGLMRFVGVLAVLCAAGPAGAAVMHGEEALRHLYAGDLLPLARVMPLHWAAGLLLGVPIGSSWAASMSKTPKPSGG